jgi:hypothetical protein
MTARLQSIGMITTPIATASMLVAITAVIGPWLGAWAKPLFIVACVVLGWHAWRQSPAAHVQATLVMFSFAPLLRRLVDAAAGFDPMGLMLAGPLLMLLVPLPQLRPLLVRPSVSGDSMPVLFFGACVGYCVLLTFILGDAAQAATGALKWGAPLVYVLALQQHEKRGEELLEAVAGAFVIILPIIGIYGIYQYIDPPDWDRYWLRMATITSAGLPAPFEIRTFSTMHGPAVFATYTAAGLAIVTFLRSHWFTRLLMLPAALALLLSLYRTAWLSLAAVIVFCAFFPMTRVRAMYLVAGVGVAICVAFLAPESGEVIGDRLATLAELQSDGSGAERLGEFATLWNLPDTAIFGRGFVAEDVAVAGAQPLDGMPAVLWMSMGIPLGLLAIAALLLVIHRAISRAFQWPCVSNVLLGGLGLGFLIQLPLASIVAGELGFLFWLLTGVATIPPRGAGT